MGCTLAAANAAVGCLDRLDRATVRARFEQRFTARRMAEDYLATYSRLAADDRSMGAEAAAACRLSPMIGPSRP
jgi:hypothetical protein